MPYKSKNAPWPDNLAPDGYSWASNPMSSVNEEPNLPDSKDMWIPPEDILPQTPAQISQLNNSDLKDEVNSMMELIDVLTKQQYSSGTGYDVLMEKRQELIDMRDLPGTWQEIYDNVFTPIADVVNSYNDYNFRFLEE